MQCQQCSQAIESGEERSLHGRTLCEDCYLDALSPLKTCDPWAVHSAKRLGQMGGGELLTEVQKQILAFLKENGPSTPAALCRQLHLSPSQLEREFAALRHMEKARGEKQGDQIVLCLW